MGAVEWLFGRPGGEAHAKGDENLVAVVSPWKTNQALPDNHDYVSLCKDAYERNPVTWACVQAIASSVAEPDLQVKKGADIAPPTHPLSRLMERPNSDEDQFEFLYRMLVYYSIAGEAVIHKVRSGTGAVVQLQLLRPDRIEPVVSKTGRVLRYEYKIDGAMIDAAVRPEDIVVMRRLHPRDDFRGLSPITVAARFADLDNQGADFLRSVLSNGGIMRGLLKLKTRTTPEQRRNVQQGWRDKYGGPSGWNELAVIDEDADYQKIGLSPEESDLSNIFGETESRICMAFGVPPILIGANIGLERATYSNYEQAMRSFWQQTLSPLFVQVAARLTHGIAREFGDDLVIGWDFSPVQALQESVDSRSARAIAEWTSGLRTRNEARDVLNLPRVTDGDVFRADIQGITEPAMIESQSAVAAERERLARIDALIERLEQG